MQRPLPVTVVTETPLPPQARRLVPVPRVYDFDETFRFLLVGPRDPTLRRGPGRLVRASRTPLGPVALDLARVAEGVLAQAWGPGAEWALERVESMLGLDNPVEGLAAPPGRLATLIRRGRGLRLGRTPFVFDALVAIVLQQRVAFRDAVSAHRRLVSTLGDVAPGPFDLRLPLAPRHWLALSSEDFRKVEVDGQRAATLRAAARRAGEVDTTFGLAPAEARRRLTQLPGCGPWTVEMTLGFALGDPDAVPVGDLHLPHLVAWALSGEHAGTDTRMLELLEPFRGHRFRLIRLLYAAGLTPPAQPPGSRQRAASGRG
jgi:3-methyladenine DNA glycosylase/8-oxoguanine DNA glycosylase